MDMARLFQGGNLLGAPPVADCTPVLAGPEVDVTTTMSGDIVNGLPEQIVSPKRSRLSSRL
jgi:hypothetical protein